MQTENVYFNVHETSIAPILNGIVERFKGRANFGSYPELFNSFYKVRITIESPNCEDLKEATLALKKEIGDEHVVNYDPRPIRNAALKVYDLAATESPIGIKTKNALHVIEKAFKKYPNAICIGFNGGKDCTALLHLVHAVHRRRNMHLDYDEKDAAKMLRGLYIRSRWAFPEVEQFIEVTAQSYHIDLIRVEGKMKSALEQVKLDHPEIEAVIMGSRSTDPYCDRLSYFEKTDPDWPDYMRVNPIIDWSYSDVWQFLRILSVPYCQMYDRGYTSLGSQENTHPNPALRKVTESGIVEYRPAFELQDPNSERCGRG